MSAIIYNILIELDARLAAGRVREREERERNERARERARRGADGEANGWQGARAAMSGAKK